jgi:hypothetical protein
MTTGWTGTSRERAAPAPFGGALPYYPWGKAQDAKTLAPRPLRPGPRSILFAWELGAGLGHLMQMLPLATDLARQGHRVGVVLRDLDRAADIYGKAGVSFLQAPYWSRPAAFPFPKPATYAHMLANIGFGSYQPLLARACAWRNLFRLVKPDLIVFDHAPTALLASRGMEVRRVLIGSGFCCPPDVTQVEDAEEPWGVLRPGAAAEAGVERLKVDEAKVLEVANRVLAALKQPPLERLGQLYSEVDENLLTTLPELDHFPSRRNAGYWGPVLCEAGGGDAPVWPEGKGKRVFAYLKPFAAAETLLAELKRHGCPTLVYMERGPTPELRRSECGTLRFCRRRLELSRVAEECGAAVLNGGHGVTAQMLLAGKPVMEVPLAMEQRLLSSAVARLGAGVAASPRDRESITRKLEALLGGACDEPAAEFASRYAAFDAGEQRRAMLERVLSLLGVNQARALA